MDWPILKEFLTSTIPEEIKKDPTRLNDYLSGAKRLYDILVQLFQDDLK